ncbi:hypothetical protein [Labrenzia sp. DG1229]|uniref:hypothetical protein n=1 Tax=Labrenzia sp. DG1229 TaxID=681847 RepID=UPI00048F83AA|nr:hypothetical protein [Labrenzia sp. DG1229]
MAHSLFEPAPRPLHELIWRRVRDFNIAAPLRDTENTCPNDRTDPALLKQAENLDARGRQDLLDALLRQKPIRKKAARP